MVISSENSTMMRKSRNHILQMSLMLVAPTYPLEHLWPYENKNKNKNKNQPYFSYHHLKHMTARHPPASAWLSWCLPIFEGQLCHCWSYIKYPLKATGIIQWLQQPLGQLFLRVPIYKRSLGFSRKLFSWEDFLGLWYMSDLTHTSCELKHFVAIFVLGN